MLGERCHGHKVFVVSTGLIEIERNIHYRNNDDYPLNCGRQVQIRLIQQGSVATFGVGSRVICETASSPLKRRLETVRR
jgi:hypothetical protein